MYEFTGKVKTVGDLQTFASGFTKRWRLWSCGTPYSEL